MSSTRWWLSSTVVVVFLLQLPYMSHQQQQTNRRCHAYDTNCSDCIQTPGCQWCSTLVGNSSKAHRCSVIGDPDVVCMWGQMEDVRNRHTVTVNIPLTEVQKRRESSNDPIVQLAPQRISLMLRKNEPYNITFKFRLATDYPVDLYYLMDLSNSMADDKEKLANLGSTLAERMGNLTSKLRLGFGSFVDKVVMPFVNVHPDMINSPCRGCASPYSFRNNLPLDADDTKFTRYVRAAPISGNVDAPEGGLDALLQAMVCVEAIGWREQARRLLVFSTDAKFHHAGDGRLAGIVTPHDGRCYLDSEGNYTHYQVFDYPSVGQINEAAKANKINIVFAVSGFETLYRALSDSIDYSSMGMLDRDSANVVKLVTDQYNEISSVVELSDNEESIAGTPLRVRYFSSCLDSNSPPRALQSCSNVREGDELEFIVQIEAVAVPAGHFRGQIHQLNITSFQDTLTLDVEILADCACEQPGAFGWETGSSQCSGVGLLQCGVCRCSPPYYGNKCQCSSEAGDQAGNTNISEEDLEQCREEVGQPQCSAQGVCECGTCICNPPLSGKYCECNQEMCAGGGSASGAGGSDRFCGGRGTCECGTCLCQSGWTGQYCECPDETSCIMPGKTEVCSGKGTCSCGSCSCNVIGDTGRYCEECSTCASGRCLEFKDCVQCKVFGSGPRAGASCNNCTLRPTHLPDLNDVVAAGAKPCTFPDDEGRGCEFSFAYEYQPSSRDYHIYAKTTLECPEELNVLAVVMGVIGGVVAVGLLTLLLWRVLTTIHDRQEFARFENERKKAQWGTAKSPIYKPALDTFTNPTFQGQASN